VADKDTEQDESSRRKPVDNLTTGLMAVAALSAIAGFGLLFSIWWQSGITDPYEILRVASQEYVNGHPIVAGDLAETVVLESEADDPTEAEPDELPRPDSDLNDFELAKRKREQEAKQQLEDWSRLREFLVGAGKVARANSESDPRDRRQLLRDALPHLKLSESEGFPPGRRTEGNRILGESNFKLGRYDEAIDSLRKAIQLDPTLSRTLSPLLAEAELYSANKAPDRALDTINQFLTEKSLQPSQIWAGEKIRIRALIDLSRWDDAQAAIVTAHKEANVANVEDPNVKQAQLEYYNDLKLLGAIAEIRKAEQRRSQISDQDRYAHGLKFPELEKPILELNELQRDAMPPIPEQAKLWTARAELIAGKNDAALTLLTAVRLHRPLGPEAIVGGLEEIEMLADQSRGEEVLQTTRYLMREIGDQQGFLPGEVSFADFRQRLINSLEELRQHGRYEHAIDTARTLPPVFEPTEALIQEAIGYRRWADATQTDGTNLSDQAARGAAQLARSRYRAAGDAFAHAATLMFDSEEYLPAQWSAIKAYQDGRHFSRSIALLEPYLRYEARRRQPRGLVAYGRALLAEGNADEAIDALTTCIEEFPRDPLRYDARLLAALAHSENGDMEAARQLLTENLQDGDLTPQSPAYRDSLFTLAELLYARGNRTYLEAERAPPKQRLEMLRDNQPTLEDAVNYLDRAVERYKWVPRAESAAYMSARAHILASRWPRIESESPEILDTAKRSLRTRADAQLQIALDGFNQLRQHLLSQEDERGLPVREQRLLRNCYIAEADVLREMNRLEEAAVAYMAIEVRYMNEPTSLEAIIGRATCMRELGREDDARTLIRLANVILGRIPKEWDGKFADTTRYDRNGWKELLDWMNNRQNDGG